VFGACSKSEKSDSETVKIQFMHMQVEQERQDAIAGMIEKFEAANPDIKVEQVPVNEDDYDTKIATLGGNGELPAVVEYNQDQAKNSVVNQFTNLDATKEVIDTKGEDAFFANALSVLKTEDGADYSAVPLCGWVQGIFVNQAMLKEKGFENPTNWDEVLKVAEAFNDPANKKYGISIPTGNNAFTEQVFSQFALSNNANVFDADGNITFDSPEMKEAVEYYQKLASFSMPGSTEVADVKDAFIGKNAPMVMYSTYIIGGAIEAEMIDDLAMVLPTNKESAAYGCVISLGISSGLEDAQTEAAKKFTSFMIEAENNIEWLKMAPGGVHPVLIGINEMEPYSSNEEVKKFSHLGDDIAAGFENLQMFGTVGDKNYMIMGDITNKSIIGKTINNVVVQKKDIATELKTAQEEIQALKK
jgi:multiple sugar transport system substrate-binding protein